MARSGISGVRQGLISQVRRIITVSVRPPGQILSSRVFCLALRPLRYSTLGSGLFGSGTATVPVSGTVRDAESSETLQ